MTNNAKQTASNAVKSQYSIGQAVLVLVAIIMGSIVGCGDVPSTASPQGNGKIEPALMIDERIKEDAENHWQESLKNDNPHSFSSQFDATNTHLADVCKMLYLYD